MQQIPDDDLSLDDYAAKATKTASYPDLGSNLIYPALGLVGEAGELAEKVKKLWRNKGKTAAHQLNIDETTELIKELGDVMWYVAAFACELRINLSFVGKTNIAKLADRQERNVIKSEGDNR